MTIQREMFITEYQIARKNKNYAFVDWLAEQIQKYDKEQEIKALKLNKIHEIEFLLGDSSIPQDVLLNAKNEIIGGLI